MRSRWRSPAAARSPSHDTWARITAGGFPKLSGSRQVYTEAMDLHAVIHDEDGTYWAEVMELPGCFASGHDLEEVKEGLIEAIILVLGEERASEGPISVRVDELKLVAA